MKDMEALESMIRQEQIGCVADLTKEIETLKATFIANTSTIEFSKKDSVISGICEKLLVKGFESISRRDRE